MKTVGKPAEKISTAGKRDLKIKNTPKKRGSRSINSTENQIVPVVSRPNIDDTEETEQKNKVTEDFLRKPNLLLT